MDIDKVFLNMENILSLSSKLLMMLKGQETLMSHEQMIGRCFTHVEQELHEEYTFYLENHMYVMNLVAQYETDKANAAMLNECLLNIRDESTCWDLQSYLIRPVQRVMKYPLLLKEMLAETPTHWPDRPFLISALKICDNIVTYANENKRKEELLRRYNSFDSGSLLPRLSLHSVKKKSKRFTTSVTHTLNITNSIVADKEFQALTEQFASIHIITKALIQESYGFTNLIKEVQDHMQALCNSIHDFYDDLSTQKDVFLYHAVALKIAQTYTPRFIEDLEGGPLHTLSELLECFGRPSLLVEKRNSKVLDYDNIIANSENPEKVNENMKIARGEFEALHEQLVEDLPILVEEGAKIVEIAAYSVLALYCQYARICYDELKQTVGKMSLDITDVPESIVAYHKHRMEESCCILLDICSFDAEVTNAIVRGGTIKHKENDSPDVETEVLEEKIRKSDANVALWVTEDFSGGEFSGNVSRTPPTDVPLVEDIETDEEKSGNTLRRFNHSPLPDVTLTGSISLTNEDDIPDLMGSTTAGTECMVMFDFVATTDGAISVKEGATVTLVMDCREEESWCYIQTQSSERGYVPKSFLVKVEDCGFSAGTSSTTNPTPAASTSTLKSKRKAPAPPVKSSSFEDPAVPAIKTLPRNKTTKKAPLAPRLFAPVPTAPDKRKPVAQTSVTAAESPEISPDHSNRRSSLVPKRAAPVPPDPKKSATVLSITPSLTVCAPSPSQNDPEPCDNDIFLSHDTAANLLLDLSNCDVDDEDQNSVSSQSSFRTADEDLPPVEDPPTDTVLLDRSHQSDVLATESMFPPVAASRSPPHSSLLSDTRPEQPVRVPDSDASLRISSLIRNEEFNEESKKVLPATYARNETTTEVSGSLKSTLEITSTDLRPDEFPEISATTVLRDDATKSSEKNISSDIFSCSNINANLLVRENSQNFVESDDRKVKVEKPEKSDKPSVLESPLPKTPSKNSKSTIKRLAALLK